MLEGTITEWYKNEGDSVEAGDVLAEVEAAKTTEDLLAPQAGVLRKVVVPEGQVVPVHELLAILVCDGEEDDVAPGAGPPVAGSSVEAAASDTAARAQPGPAGGTARNVVPRARLLATELGVDLTTVVGTGPGGRIGEADVRAAASTALPPESAQGQAEPERGTTIPLTAIRATIARRMHASLQSTAQLTLVTTADVTELVAHREGLVGRPRPADTDFIVKAVALALREHPGLNATLDRDHVRLLPDVHIGIATAVRNGLIVPVIRDADTKSLGEIARESAAVLERVRGGTFASEEISGSTFTVSSLGGQGVDAFTPIINPPEVAILGVGRIFDQPIRDDDGVAWRKVITLSLTIDHQVVDGVPGAAFLETVGEFLGSPEMLAG